MKPAWRFRSRRWTCTCGKARTKIRIFPQQRRETSVFGAEIFVDFSSKTPGGRFIRSSFGGSGLFNLYILDAVFKYHVDKLIARIVAFARDFIKTLQNIFPNTHGNDSVPVLSALFNLQRFIFHKFHLTIYTNYRLTAEL